MSTIDIKDIVKQTVLVIEETGKYVAFGEFTYREGRFMINKMSAGFISDIIDICHMRQYGFKKVIIKQR
jgi:translation initiation factor 2 alpha subunit (eIF-2alpha)